MTFILSQQSLSKLSGVNQDLVKVVKRAIELTTVDFLVLEGLRSLARQAQLVAEGHSQTIHSKHCIGRAVDLAALKDGKISWDWPLYEEIAKAMKAAAAELKVPLTWGGEWKTLKDGPHFELP